MYQQDVARLKGQVQETQMQLRKAHNKLDRYGTVSKAKKVSKILVEVEIPGHTLYRSICNCLYHISCTGGLYLYLSFIQYKLFGAALPRYKDGRCFRAFASKD